MQRILASSLHVLFTFLVILGIGSSSKLLAQESAARVWNDVLLEAVRNDVARPTIHARNLFHHSVVTWDAWAAYDTSAQTVLLGNTLGDFYCPFEGIVRPEDPVQLKAAREEAISYAMYRLLRFRFQNSPGVIFSYGLFDITMEDMGYNTAIMSTDYSDGSPARLGNYIAAKMIEFGLQDGSNESLGFSNQYYLPVNPDLVMVEHGNPDIIDPNRWQPLELEGFIDQGGNPFPTVPPFLSPEWGNVVPFCLQESEMNTYTRDGYDWNVYHDPGSPPLIDTTLALGLESPYKHGFIQVALWQGHHDPNDGVMWDISPASIGNLTIDQYPTDHNDYGSFFNLYEGGDISTGRNMNPATGLPYEPQVVPRADYARILAEFWADGPHSESPPGHWFEIMNYVSDHPQFEKRWNGEGEILDDLEWDAKAYLTMGGAMHDVAITCWAIKGFYDFIRPVSAIRYMAEKGQCSDPELPNFHPAGFPLIPGKIELVQAGDPLVGGNEEYLNEVKIYTWRGPLYINDIETEYAGVDWILAKDWWPYQRPSFVTPPFAAYVSGHSTYSRCAAEIMTLITGNEFFPGGMGEFNCAQNEFLVFEDGPTMDVTLQWATYRDASDQCSLSRIWGGIHPPCDDIPGRLIGAELGPEAYSYAIQFFDPGIPKITSITMSQPLISDTHIGDNFSINLEYNEAMNPDVQPQISFPEDNPLGSTLLSLNGSWVSATEYQMEYSIQDNNIEMSNINIRVDGAIDLEMLAQKTYLYNEQFIIDTYNPNAISTIANLNIVTDIHAGSTLNIVVQYDQEMNETTSPDFIFDQEILGTLVSNSNLSNWSDNQTYNAVFDVFDFNIEAYTLNVYTSGAEDLNGNNESGNLQIDVLTIDTHNPELISAGLNESIINDDLVGAENFSINLEFDEIMDIESIPTIVFSNLDMNSSLSYNALASAWTNGSIFTAVYDVIDANIEIEYTDYIASAALDANGNLMVVNESLSSFIIDTKNPEIISITANNYQLIEADVAIAAFELLLVFDDEMDQSFEPQIDFPELGAFAFTLNFNSNESEWLNQSTFRAKFDLVDSNLNQENIDVSSSNLVDDAGNYTDGYLVEDFFHISLDPDGVNEEIFAETSIYPNPVFAGSELLINTPQGQGQIHIEVFGNNGALMKSLTISQNQYGPYGMSTSDLSSGIYLIRLSSGTAYSTKRFQVID